MIMDFKKKLVGAWKRIPIVVKGLAVITGLIAWHYCDPETAKFVAYLIGGGLLLWQVRASSQRAKAADETAKAMQQTADSTEKGNIAERFKNAIEHLGHESPSVRMGGIYALHHIAQDEKEYRERVFEILCAHIRDTTTQDGYKPLQHSIKKRRHEVEGGRVSDDWLTVDTVEPSIEIQSILRLLFVRHAESKIYSHFRVNLAGANLQGAILAEIKQDDIVGVKWKNADLTNTNLQDVTLNHADLVSAWMGRANLHKTMLQGAIMKGANLDHTNAQEADFLDADLQGCNFYNANLQDAYLAGNSNLTAEQLLEAKTLCHAALPDEIEAEIERRKPELLEEPKADNEPEA